MSYWCRLLSAGDDRPAASWTPVNLPSPASCHLLSSRTEPQTNLDSSGQTFYPEPPAVVQTSSPSNPVLLSLGFPRRCAAARSFWRTARPTGDNKRLVLYRSERRDVWQVQTLSSQHVQYQEFMLLCSVPEIHQLRMSPGYLRGRKTPEYSLDQDFFMN